MSVFMAFAAPIGGRDLTLDSGATVAAVAGMRASCLWEATDRRSMRGGYRSRDLMSCAVPEIEKLRSLIVRAFVGVIEEICSARGCGVGSPTIRELWFNVLGRGDYHVPHEHHPFPWAGVLYVRAAHAGREQSGALEIYPPAGRTVWAPASVVIPPVDGRMIVFPGALLHMVHPHESDEERIAFAFNAA